MYVGLILGREGKKGCRFWYYEASAYLTIRQRTDDSFTFGREVGPGPRVFIVRLADAEDDLVEDILKLPSSNHRIGNKLIQSQ